ncbi:MAG: hypothetical protein ACREAC_22355, partial [Blastocatellia bacterium]
MPVEHGVPDLRLAAADLSGNWESDNLKYRVDFTLTCGPEIINGGDRKYEANLNQCLVTLSAEGCKADFLGPYTYSSTVKIKRTEKRLADVSRSTKREIGGGGSAVAKRRGLFQILAKINLGGTQETKHGEVTEDILESEQLVRLIDYRPIHYWAVGDDTYGDSRNTGRWLRGQYFREDPTRPLCKCDLYDRKKETKLRIDVWARPGQISIRELSASDWPEDEARLGRRNDALKILEMKAVLRGMATAKVRPSAFYPQLPLIDAKGPTELIRLD